MIIEATIKIRHAADDFANAIDEVIRYLQDKKIPLYTVTKIEVVE